MLYLSLFTPLYYISIIYQWFLCVAVFGPFSLMNGSALCIYIYIYIYIYIHIHIFLWYKYIPELICFWWEWYNCFEKHIGKIIDALNDVSFLQKIKFSQDREVIGILPLFNCCSVSQSCPTLQPRGLHHARLPCPSPSLGACTNSCPLSRWCLPTISSSVVPFSSCLQSFPASVSFQMTQFCTSDDQWIGASASASVFPISIQDWLSLGLADLISLLSRGLSRVFSNTKVQRHQLFGAQAFLLSSSHIHTWLLEKP